MTDMKLINRLLIVVSLCFTLAGIIFLGLSIFAPEPGSYDLAKALGAIALANLFNVIRMQMAKKDE